MAGHSEWSNIKHQKKKEDKKRGKLFSKLSRKIRRAARKGSPDPDKNVELKWAIEEARDADMPKENIQRAIDKATGQLKGGELQTIQYEGYAAGGVAVLIVARTDNRNRTNADIREIFKDHNGKMAEAGAVTYLFESKSSFQIHNGNITEEELLEIAIEAGAEEMEPIDHGYRLLGDSKQFSDLREALNSSEATIEEANIVQMPTNKVSVKAEHKQQIQTLKEALLDNPDVESVYTNLKQHSPN